MDGLIALALAKKYTDKVGQDIISAGFKVQVEEDRSILNRQGEEKVLYLLPKEYGSSQDGYDEFVYANNRWEWVGKTDVDLDYELLSNKPKIHGIPIEGNQGHEAYNLFGLSTPLNWMLNFGNLVNMSAKNGILNATINQVESLPEFMNPKDKHFIIFDYQAGSQGIWDIAVWIDATTNEPKMAFRAGTHNIYSVSDWVELTGGGAQIVSGVVNANGTITFTDSEGNSFTTSGESVIGADGFSPSATVQQTASGATITVTDKTGTTTANITNGQDYVLTEQDKDNIANIVLAEFTGSIVNGELNTR